MKLFVSALVFLGCSSGDLPIPDDPPDLKRAAASDLSRLFQVDLSTRSDLTVVGITEDSRPSDLTTEMIDMARAVDMAMCGGDGQPCCGGVPVGPGNTYCAAPPPLLNCFASTCQQCGNGGTAHQPCCGGDAQHLGGMCFTGTCLDATHALAGHCG